MAGECLVYSGIAAPPPAPARLQNQTSSHTAESGTHALAELSSGSFVALLPLSRFITRGFELHRLRHAGAICGIALGKEERSACA